MRNQAVRALSILGLLGLGLVASPASARSFFVWPVVRANLGAAGLLSPELRAELAFDLNAGILAFRNSEGTTPTWALSPELGYSLRYAPSTGNLHLGTLGFGVGYGNLSANGIYSARFVVGKSGDDLAIGFRHGPVGHFLISILSVELSHQMLSIAGALHHELCLTVGLNPAAGILLPALSTP